MATKHIPDETWDKVEKELVKAVLLTKKNIKPSRMLELIILKGLENVGESDYWHAAGKEK